MKTVLETNGNATWTLRRYDATGNLVEEVANATPVSVICRRLKKSRRQVYRYLKSGAIRPLGKFLGEWLVDVRGADHLVRRSVRLRPLPPSARILFPEYATDQLNPYRNASLIIPKIDNGTGRSNRDPLDALAVLVPHDQALDNNRWLAPVSANGPFLVVVA